MLIMTVLFSLYAFLSRKLFLSLPSKSANNYLSYDRVFHQIINTVELNPSPAGVVERHFLPQRPRTLGYYYEDIRFNKGIVVAIEIMDPNVVRLYNSRHNGMPDVTAEELERQEQLRNSKDYGHGETDPFEHGNCVAQYEWQKSSFPTCNFLMEQDLTNLALNAETGKSDVRMIAHGYWRDVWRMRNPTTTGSTVLKTMRYEHDFQPRNYDRHRRDAVAMERLTSSESVMDIYGFCGNSGIFEFGDGGSIEEAIWNGNKDPWNSTERLIVAYQVVTGIAEMHNFAKEGRSAMAHTDITTSQFVYVGALGGYKLNDFNRCRFIRWNKKEDKACTYHVGNNPGTVSS
jgi:hypothetical protein